MWIARICDLEESGLTQEEWCKNHKIPYSTLRYWLSKLKKEAETEGRETNWLKVDMSAGNEIATVHIPKTSGEGGADENLESQLGDFAWNLGMAFQLVDDILDFTSSEKILGKPSGNDLREGKVTLPMIYALETATPEEQAAVEAVIADGNYEQVPFMRIRQMLESKGCIARAYQRAHSFTEKARQIIHSFPESPHIRWIHRQG